MASEQPTFGARLKAWRVRSGLTQAEAADAFPVGRTYYSKLESGKKTPGKFLIEKFELLEKEPVLKRQSASAASAHDLHLHEDAPDTSIHALMKKLIYIEEHGTPDQIAAMDDVLDGIYDRLRATEDTTARIAEEPPASPPTPARAARRKSVEPASDEPKSPGKKIGFHSKKRPSLLLHSGLNPAFAS